MIHKLQYAFTMASDLLCYGRDDLKSAAVAGAIDTLLISGDAWLTGTEDNGVVSLVKRHGGRVVRACAGSIGRLCTPAVPNAGGER